PATPWRVRGTPPPAARRRSTPTPEARCRSTPPPGPAPRRGATRRGGWAHPPPPPPPDPTPPPPPPPPRPPSPASFAVKAATRAIDSRGGHHHGNPAPGCRPQGSRGGGWPAGG